MTSAHINWDIKRLVDQATSGDRTVIRLLLEARDETQEYLFATARAARDAVFGPAAVVRGVIEVGNACTKSCLYCPMRVENRDKRYSLGEEAVLDSVAAIRSAGIGVVFLQSGEVPGTTRTVGRLLPEIRRQFDDEVEILLCLGTKPYEDLAFLRRNGAASYILKHETSDPSLHELMRHAPLSERLNCARNLLDIGYRLGLGTIVGLPGQSLDSLVEDILLPGRMGAQMASASPFIPAARTPLAQAPLGDVNMTLNVIALLRLLQPAPQPRPITRLGAPSPFLIAQNSAHFVQALTVPACLNVDKQKIGERHRKVVPVEVVPMVPEEGVNV